MLTTEITLSKDISVEIRDKFSKFIDYKVKDICVIKDENESTILKTSFDKYYDTLVSTPAIHKCRNRLYYDYILSPNLKLEIDVSKFTISRKFRNLTISPIIELLENTQTIEGINLIIPKDTKFKITYIKIGNRLSSKCGVKIKITDCPVKALNGITLDLPISFMDHFKLEQI